MTRLQKGLLVNQDVAHASQEGNGERVMQTQSAQRDLQDRCALRLPKQQSNAQRQLDAYAIGNYRTIRLEDVEGLRGRYEGAQST
jgi:hypothetical protein